MLLLGVSNIKLLSESCLRKPTDQPVAANIETMVLKKYINKYRLSSCDSSVFLKSIRDLS